MVTFYHTGKGLYFLLFYDLCFINGTKSNRAIPDSTTIKNIGSEQILKKKLNDVNSFKNSITNIKERITYIKNENRKSKETYKTYKMLNKILKSFDTIFTIAQHQVLLGCLSEDLV